MSDPYAELGLKRGATDEEIKAAFRRLAHVHHPDKQTTAATRAEAKFAFNRITAARNLLLGTRTHASASAGAPAWNGPTPPRVNRLSNLAFAVVLTFPLCLIGVVSNWAFPSDGGRLAARLSQGDDGTNENNHMGRIHGVLEPPVNPWLRDDVVHAGRRKGHHRPHVTTRISRRVFRLLGMDVEDASRGEEGSRGE